MVTCGSTAYAGIIYNCCCCTRARVTLGGIAENNDISNTRGVLSTVYYNIIGKESGRVSRGGADGVRRSACVLRPGGSRCTRTVMHSTTRIGTPNTFTYRPAPLGGAQVYGEKTGIGPSSCVAEPRAQQRPPMTNIFRPVAVTVRQEQHLSLPPSPSPGVPFSVRRDRSLLYTYTHTYLPIPMACSISIMI